MKIFRTSDFVLAATGFLAFILSLPLIEPFSLSRLGAIICMAIFGMVGIGRELAGPGVPASRSPAFWCLPLLWLLMLASVAWSAAPFNSFIAFATFSLPVLGFVVFATGRGIFRLLILIMPPVLLVLCGLAIWALLQYFVLKDWLVNGQVRYPFNNPNNYASLLMLGFFPALGWLLAAVKPKTAIIATIVCGLLLAGIAVINGLMVLILTATGFMFTLVVCRGRIKACRNALAAVAITGLAVLALHCAMPGNEKLKDLTAAQRPDYTASQQEQSLETRINIWKATAAMIHDRPWLGTGYGTFSQFYPQYRLGDDAWSSGMMAHNDLLQLWSETGILASVLLLTLYGAALMRMIAVLRLRGPASGERALCFALFAGAGAVAMNAMVNFDLYTASILCLLGIVLGLWFRYTGLVLNDKTENIALPAALPPSAGWCAIVLPLLLMTFVAQGFLRSEYHADLARAALQSGNLDQFKRQVDLSRKTGFDRSARPYMLAAILPVSILQQKGGDLSPLARDNMVMRADNLLSRAEERNPRLVAIYYDRAIIASYMGARMKKDERNWLRQTLILNPAHIPARMMLADLDYQAGHKTSALDVLAEGLDIGNTAFDPESYLNMTASIALEQGKTATANKALRRLADWKDRANHPAAAETEQGDSAVAPQ